MKHKLLGVYHLNKKNWSYRKIMYCLGGRLTISPFNDLRHIYCACLWEISCSKVNQEIEEVYYIIYISEISVLIFFYLSILFFVVILLFFMLKCFFMLKFFFDILYFIYIEVKDISQMNKCDNNEINHKLGNKILLWLIAKFPCLCIDIEL